jgi:hypothetical protein
MVPTVADATPRYFFSTELIIALVLGEENMPKPKPTMARIADRYVIDECSVRKVSMISPPVIIPMPADARILGSYLSESRPEMDATMAIITG